MTLKNDGAYQETDEQQFLLYVLLLVYFLFFFEEYGRVAAEERVYRYNLIPFLEIRRF